MTEKSPFQFIQFRIGSVLRLGKNNRHPGIVVKSNCQIGKRIITGLSVVLNYSFSGAAQLETYTDPFQKIRIS